MKKIFLLILPLLYSCYTSDECDVYDDSIGMMFFYQVNDNQLYEKLGQGEGKLIPYDENENGSIEIAFILDKDTICKSSQYSKGAWSDVYIRDNYNYPSVVKYTCKIGAYCNHVQYPKNEHKLKINVAMNDYSIKKQYTDSIMVKFNHAYGFFLEPNVELIQKSTYSNMDLSNLSCVNGFCVFSYNNNNRICKRGTLGDECFAEY